MLSELLTRGRRVLRTAVPALLSWLAALVAVLVVLIAPGPLSAAVTAAIVVLLWSTRLFAGIDLAAGSLAAVAVALAAASGARDGWSWPLALAMITVLILGFAAPGLKSLLRSPVDSVRLPVTRPWFTRVAAPATDALGLGLLLLAAHLGAGLPGVVVLSGVVLLACAAGGISLAQLRWLRRHQPERALAAALSALAPRSLLYYAGPAQGAYQLRMWLEPLAQAGEPAAILVRDREFLATAAALSNLPVLQADTVEAMEYLMVPGLRAIFYVNNDARNADGVRFARLRHVFLGHGDSDKPSSWSAMAGIYDQIFVAGQAGIDRFADHGVLIPEAKFVRVGRPQLAATLQVSEAASDTPRTVLYAPTWRGGLDDMQLGSLAFASQLVEALLAAGARVIFRPHPLSFRDAESRVLIGRADALLEAAPDSGLTSAQASALSITECMNRSDAMVADVSSVVSDYLYTNKPFAVLVSPGKSALIADSALARAGLVVNLGSDLAAQLAALFGPDDRAEARRQARHHYLGDGSGSQQQAAFISAIGSALGQKD